MKYRHSYGDGVEEQSEGVNDSVRDPEDSTGGTPERKKSEVSVRKTRNQEAVKTLLASFGEDVDRCSDEFARQEVRFKDLSALSGIDLAMLGVDDPGTHSAMLETFQELPNQEMDYERLCATTEAQEYNEQILGRSQCHLNSMNTSLSAAYLKMLVNPSNDVIVDDSIFASRFVLEALDELKKTTEDMEDRLRALEQIAVRNAKINLSNRAGRNFYKTLVVIGGICTGVSIAFWFWKGR